MVLYLPYYAIGEISQMNYLRPDWPAPANIHAYTLLRHGDLHQIPQLPSEPCWLNQTHGTRVVRAGSDPNADASFTDQANIICVVKTADCLPLLLCRRDGTAVAAIHAGWRGLADGIIGETLKVFPAMANDILVWLGPAIGPEKFEVGDEVRERFMARNGAIASAFQPSTRPGHWLANLYQLARLDLHAVGVTAIYGGQYCTYSNPDLFYSYRRDGKMTGRMASLIWIDAVMARRP
jgi:YfiH family protein